MIVRDTYIEAVIQHPVFDEKSAAGDSARTTGMLALFGSELDQLIQLDFEEPSNSGLLTRHPIWYDDSCFTRDQLIPFVCSLTKRDYYKSFIRRIFWSHAKRLFFCQNYMTQFPDPKTGERVNKGFFGRDPLSPSHIGMLILASKLYIFYPFLLLAIPWFYLDLFYFTKVAPRQEQNQIIAMSMVYGKIELWTKWHPNWKQSILDYWAAPFSWRDQIEVGQIIIEGIEKEITKEQ